MCLENMFDRIGNSGVKLNQPKCKFGVDNVGYVGHVLSKDGLKPSPDRIHAIWDMPAPQGKGELSTFLGMMTYLGDGDGCASPVDENECCVVVGASPPESLC